MSDTIFDSNFAIIQQRFPNIGNVLAAVDANHLSVETQGCTLVVNQIQLTSSYDREKEALIQCQHIADNEEEVTICGVGLADCINLLLTKPRLRKLNVIVLNEAIFLYVLHAMEHESWLNESRVQLYLAKDFNAISGAFVALPGELTLAQPNALPLVDKIKARLDQPFLNEQFQQQNSIRVASIEKNMHFVEQDDDISRLPKLSNDEVIVIGAGPSLDRQLETLKTTSSAIIAVDASLKVLLENDIVPNYVVSIDYTAYRFFESLDLSNLTNASLLYFPHVQSEVLSAWPGKRIVSYSNTPMYQDLKKSHPKTMLYSAGSVIHPAIDLAKMLGASTITLMGVDFAFCDNKSHAGCGNDSHRLPMATAQEQVENNLGEQVPTMTSFKRYLHDLEDYIKLNGQLRFLNASLHGAKIVGTDMWKEAK